MEHKFIEENIKYTGAELCPHFAYKRFGILGDSLIGFTGEADVKLSEMVDIEDVLENAPIYSENMLHFIAEHFQIGLSEGIALQRLLVSIAKDIVQKHAGKAFDIERRGDDIFANGQKLSVSIATKSLTSVLIHFAMNISSNNTPIKTSGLETDLNIKDIKNIANEILIAYTEEVKGIKRAGAKVRGVV